MKKILHQLWNLWIYITIFGALYAFGSWLQDIALNFHWYKGLIAAFVALLLYILFKYRNKI